MTNRRQSMLRSAASLCRGIGDLLLPGLCPACNQRPPTLDGLCERCARARLMLLAMPYCPRCGSTLGPGIRLDPGGCWQCPSPLPRFTRTVRLGPYAEPIRQTVRQLKYGRLDTLSAAATDLLAHAIRQADDLPLPDVIVAIPAHWRRRIGRGRDHAALIARRLSRALGVPLQTLLTRTRPTPPQTHLSRSARITNVRNAFAAKDTASLKDAHVLLIDDVTTTGATANECARTLRTAGASHVTLGVLAKSEPPEAYAEYLPAQDA